MKGHIARRHEPGPGSPPGRGRPDRDTVVAEAGCAPGCGDARRPGPYCGRQAPAERRSKPRGAFVAVSSQRPREESQPSCEARRTPRRDLTMGRLGRRVARPAVLAGRDRRPVGSTRRNSYVPGGRGAPPARYLLSACSRPVSDRSRLVGHRCFPLAPTAQVRVCIPNITQT